MKQMSLLILVAASLLAACGPAVTPAKPEAGTQLLSSPTGQPATPLAVKTAAPGESTPLATASVELAETTPVVPGQEGAKEEGVKADSLEDAVVIFHRTGGIAGLDQQCIIHADGRIELPGSEQQWVDADSVQALLETIQSADFFELDDSYVPADTCCDRFTYTVTVHLDDQTKTVVTMDASPTQPDRLTMIMSAISEIIFP